MPHNQIVDLFAGPGGVDVAAEKLMVPSVGIEWDPDAVATRTAAGLLTEHGDVRAFGPRDFPTANVLAGGPPCQTFTVAGSGVGRRALDDVLDAMKCMAARQPPPPEVHAEGADERTALVLEPLRWALEAVDCGEPYEAIVLEQVPAVLPVWEMYAEYLSAEGYTTAHGILRTEEYGVPQTRRRAVFIARRDGRDVRLPEPTHRPYRKGVPRTEGDSGQLPWVPMNDVLRRPYDFSVISNYGTGGDPKLRGRRKSCEPSATVTGKVSRNRVVRDTGEEAARFSNSEAGRLQTFPRDYPWTGRAVAQQIGNAVPPRLAVHVLAAALRMGPPTESTLADLESWPGRKTEYRLPEPVSP